MVGLFAPVVLFTDDVKRDVDALPPNEAMVEFVTLLEAPVDPELAVDLGSHRDLWGEPADLDGALAPIPEVRQDAVGR